MKIYVKIDRGTHAWFKKWDPEKICVKIDRGTHVWWGAFKKGRLASLTIFLTLRKQNASWGLFEGSQI